METKRYLKHLKVSLILLPCWVHSQDWEKVNEITLNQIPTAYAADYQGNLYLGFADGKLTKYDAKGSILENFALSNNSSISLIDVQNNLRPFLFYFDNQQITILDRFSSVPKNYLLSDLGLEIGMMTCPSPDGDFWILENNPQRLKKVDPLRKATVLEAQLILGDSIKQMQAYQNLLIISSQNRLHILDQFGGIVHSLKFDNLINFQLIKEQLYVFTDEKIIEIDPYKGIIKDSVAKPSKSSPLLKSKDLFLSIENRCITYYRITE